MIRVSCKATYKNVPKLSTIERFAKALNVDPLDFFKNQDKTPLEPDIKVQIKKNAIIQLLEKELDNILQD